MRRKMRTITLALLGLVLLLANIQVATAHNWWLWHWDRSGNPTTIGMWIWGSNQSEARAAIQDWNERTILSLPIRSSHTDVSVYGANSGNTGWWGLATIEDSSFGWWDCWWWCHIQHAHATYNSFYGGSSADIRGVFCQEIGHTFGLDHSNTGDCMGKGYYNNSNVVGPHNVSDINRYLPGSPHP